MCTLSSCPFISKQLTKDTRDPLFQRALVNIVRRLPHLFQGSSSTANPSNHHNTGNNNSASDAAEDPHAWTGLPVIFDEVFTGIYRLGRFTAASFLGVHADISVHAKLLTGGLVPLCTTLASESIFGTFSGTSDKTDALLHGHSYTAHPVGCQVAVESLKQMAELDRTGRWDWAKSNGWIVDNGLNPGNSKSNETRSWNGGKVWSMWPVDLVESLSEQTGRVMGVWALGSVLAIHLRDQDTGYVSNAAVSLRNALLDGQPSGKNGPGSWNVHCRVLGNVLYLMTGQTTTKSSVDDICRLLTQKLK